MATYRTKLNPFTGELTIVPDVDGIVENSHEQNSDTKLAEGTADEVSANELRSHVDSSSNPHNVTKSQVGLSDVPNLDTTDAVNKAHDQNTDTKLDEGNPNEVSASELRTALDTTIPSKADKVSGAVNGDLATLDASGNLIDSGYAPTDFEPTLGFTAVPDTRTVNGHPLTSDVTVTSSDVSLGNVTNDVQLKAADLDTDGTLSANSDTKIPSQKAVKTYTDQLIAAANAVVYKGAMDCSTNPNYPAADAGWLYVVSVAGKIGGVLGVTVESGDIFICTTDGTASGDQITVGSFWNVIEKNDTGVVSGPASAIDNNVATFDGVTGKLIKDSGITSANISSAISLKHTQNSDTKLDEGNPNEVTSASLRSHLDSISNPHSVTKTQVGLSNVTNDAQLKAADLDTDGTLAANSDTKIASQKATKTYVDSFKFAAIQFIFDGGGSTITTGIQGDIEIPFNCTITKAILLADQTGSIVIDIWKDTYANFAPTVADTITASAKPTISTAIKSSDATLTGWTTTLSKADILRFNIDSVTSIQRCTLILEVSKT